MLAKAQPDFWQTLSEFINYRSQIQLADVQSLLRQDLPNCVDRDPTPLKFSLSADGRFIRIDQPAFYENCRLTLDSKFDSERVNDILHQKAAWLTFRHCLMLYHGGPINLITDWHNHVTEISDEGKSISGPIVVNGSTLGCEKCLYEFVLAGPPPRQAQQFVFSFLNNPEPSPNFPKAVPKKS